MSAANTNAASSKTPPSDHGFVFSKAEVERCSERMMRQNEARFELDPNLRECLQSQ
jgi:hypothetical protein